MFWKRIHDSKSHRRAPGTYVDHAMTHLGKGVTYQKVISIHSVESITDESE
jgi:hypothetical protein